MTNQVEKARLFSSLHVKGDPLVLFNIWDAGSALAVQQSGAKAIATGSWSVAAAQGYSDGEEMPFSLALANLQRIIARVDLPVTIDLESGYGPSASEVQSAVRQVVEAGAVGINFEDQVVGGEGLYAVEVQSSRIKAVREAADALSVPLFINARTDLFLQSEPSEHSGYLDEAVQRAYAYAAAGGSGFFAPGLKDATLIGKLCELSPLPVNIMFLPGIPSSKELASLGVARISYGPAPYRQMMKALKEAGRLALSIDQPETSG